MSGEKGDLQGSEEQCGHENRPGALLSENVKWHAQRQWRGSLYIGCIDGQDSPDPTAKDPSRQDRWPARVVFGKRVHLMPDGTVQFVRDSRTSPGTSLVDSRPGPVRS